jgi:hypothetical protein
LISQSAIILYWKAVNPAYYPSQSDLERLLPIQPIFQADDATIYGVPDLYQLPYF